MKFEVSIDCENDAFHPNPSVELARIMSSVSSYLDTNPIPIECPDSLITLSTVLYDINGNKVGTAEVIYK